MATENDKIQHTEIPDSRAAPKKKVAVKQKVIKPKHKLLTPPTILPPPMDKIRGGAKSIYFSDLSPVKQLEYILRGQKRTRGVSPVIQQLMTQLMNAYLEKIEGKPQEEITDIRSVEFTAKVYL